MFRRNRRTGTIRLGAGSKLRASDDDILSGLVKGSYSFADHHTIEASFLTFRNDAEEPNNPQGYHLIGSYYQEKAQKDFTISQAERMRHAKSGLEAVERALKLNSEYTEALVYKGLLLRTQALLEKDPKLQQQLIKEAVALNERAQQIRAKQRASGAE